MCARLQAERFDKIFGCLGIGHVALLGNANFADELSARKAVERSVLKPQPSLDNARVNGMVGILSD